MTQTILPRKYGDGDRKTPLRKNSLGVAYLNEDLNPKKLLRIQEIGVALMHHMEPVWVQTFLYKVIKKPSKGNCDNFNFDANSRKSLSFLPERSEFLLKLDKSNQQKQNVELLKDLGLLMTGRRTVCTLSLERRWSGPHTCLCILGLPGTQLHHSTATHLTPYLSSISMSQLFIPLGFIWCGICWDSTEWLVMKTFLFIQCCVLMLTLTASGCICSVDEPTNPMCNVLLQRFVYTLFVSFSTWLTDPLPTVQAWACRCWVQHMTVKNTINTAWEFLTNRCLKDSESPCTHLSLSMILLMA